MTFDMQAILESKRIYRRRLTELPYVEKLKLLDQLRERSEILAASRAQLSNKPAQQQSVGAGQPTRWPAPTD